MSRPIPLLLATLAILGTARAQVSDGLNQATGVNLTVDEGFGARQSGMGIGFASFQRDADAAVNSPAGMNDVDDFTFSTAHAEKFGRAQFDDFAFILPFDAGATLGLGLSRFGVNDIDLRPEGSDPFQTKPQGLFSVADYALTGSFARRWGALDAGFSLDMLYRHLDQDAMGLRGDAMVSYTWDDRFRLSGLVKGLIPSTANWESGYMEYESPDLYIGGSGKFPAPYFYGTLEAAFQTDGLLTDQAKSAQGLNGARLDTDPMGVLAATRVGLEFLFDFGVAVRVGMTEIAPHSVTSTTTYGIGYNWRHIVGVDYSFTPHPDLLSTHRVSLQLTPAFQKLNGRAFRPHPAVAPASAKPVEAVPIEEGEIEEPATPSPEAVPAPRSTAPVAPAAPAAAPAAPPKTQAAPTPVAPAAPAGEKEILDED